MQAAGLICEGPRCTKGANGLRVAINWVPEAVKESVHAMPDPFFRFIVAQQAYEEPIPNGAQLQEVQPVVRHFCSAGCLRDYYGKDYKPPRSPKEIVETLENNKKVEEERERDLKARAAKREGNLIEFPKPLTEEEKHELFDKTENDYVKPAEAPEPTDHSPSDQPDGIA